MNYSDFCEKYKLNLNSEQSKAVQHIDGPLLMISVPGSGKTTVIITRLAYMILCKNIPADKILTVTFGVDAAQSMKKRFMEKFYDEDLNNNVPEFRTIHSLSLNIIKLYCSVNNKTPYTIIKDSAPIIKKILKSNKLSNLCSDKTIKDIVNRISKFRNLAAEERITGIVDGINIKHIYGLYTDYKSKAECMDFDDILVNALNILKNNPDIIMKIQEKYKYFNVDEAQDNSKIQNDIINLLASENNNLFMVGDEDQCIYGFRGAYPQSFFEFEEKWGSDSIVKLQTNYRSSNEILKAAEFFISQNRNRYEKNLKGIKNDSGSVSIKNYSTLKEMNNYIFNDLVKYDDIAVLSRNNDSLIPVAYLLYKNSMGFIIGTRKNDFFDSYLINDIIILVKSGLGKESKHIPYYLQALLKEHKQLSYLNTLTPSAAMEFIIKDMHYSKIIASKYKERYSPQEICSKLNIIQYIASHNSSLQDFLDDINSFKNTMGTGKSKEGISLLTCHGSKGLEFEKVYLIDVSENVFPASDPVDPDLDCYESDIEEEVRLFYVAMTRAKKEFEILNIKNSSWGMSFPSIFVKKTEGIMKGYEIKQTKHKKKKHI